MMASTVLPALRIPTATRKRALRMLRGQDRGRLPRLKPLSSAMRLVLLLVIGGRDLRVLDELCYQLVWQWLDDSGPNPGHVATGLAFDSRAPADACAMYTQFHKWFSAP